MRLTSSTLLSALCWTARLASAVQIFTFDPELPPSDGERSRTLSPIEARLVLAQRIGVEDYHIDDLLSPGGLKAINDFGVREPLFRDADSYSTIRYIFLAEADADDQCRSLCLRAR